jgi:hypothetical protein
MLDRIREQFVHGGRQFVRQLWSEIGLHLGPQKGNHPILESKAGDDM